MLTTKNNLAALYHAQGKDALAEALYEETIDGQTTRLGANHPDTLKTKLNFAEMYFDQGKHDVAEKLYTDVLQGSKVSLGADHPDTLTAKNNLATLYWTTRTFDRSIPLFEELVEQNTKRYGAEHPETMHARINLGVNYRDGGRLDDGIRTLGEALKVIRDNRDSNIAWVAIELATAHDQAKQYDQSEPLYREALQFSRKHFGDKDPRTASLVALLGLNLLAQKKHADAEPLLRDCLAGRQKLQPDDWATFNTMSMLGEALFGQKKYSDAEPLLKDGYDGLKQRRNKIPEPVRKRRLIEALERLIRLYEATDDKDEVARWRKELDSAKQ
jgi:tetratricopeptide (TPR) repeat protein